MTYSQTTTGLSPNTGASVTITPVGFNNIAVTGPAEPVSMAALTIYGTNSLTAALAIPSSGPFSATSVVVNAGVSLVTTAAPARATWPRPSC